MVITIATVIGVCDDWNEIELYGNSKTEWLKGFLKLPEGIPSHDIFNHVFATVDPEVLQERFLFVGLMLQLLQTGR